MIHNKCSRYKRIWVFLDGVNNSITIGTLNSSQASRN